MVSNNTGACSQTSKSPPGSLHYSFLDNTGYTSNSTELSASAFAGKGSS